MRIGYGRVSTRDQNPDSQHDAAFSTAPRVGGVAGAAVAQAVQLGVEYALTPFDGGSPHKTPPEVVELVRARRMRRTAPS